MEKKGEIGKKPPPAKQTKIKPTSTSPVKQAKIKQTSTPPAKQAKIKPKTTIPKPASKKTEINPKTNLPAKQTKTKHKEKSPAKETEINTKTADIIPSAKLPSKQDDIPPFKLLPISTQTVMVYLNCTFNIATIFKKLPFEDIGDTPIKEIAGVHGKLYQIKKSKKGEFRNQKTTCIYILDKMITAKIFPTGKFHLTGCKNLAHQRYASIELANHIRRINTPEEPTIIMDDPAKGVPLKIVLEVVMVNVDFTINFSVDQKKLDKLLQQECDFYTIYDTPCNTSVNCKICYTEPTDRSYQQIILTGTVNNPKIKFTITKICEKAKEKAVRTHTFLVFSSSKVILSGRYYDTEMNKAYYKFNKFVNDHRAEIEVEKTICKFDKSKLIGLNLPLNKSNLSC